MGGLLMNGSYPSQLTMLILARQYHSETYHIHLHNASKLHYKRRILRSNYGCG